MDQAVSLIRSSLGVIICDAFFFKRGMKPCTIQLPRRTKSCLNGIPSKSGSQFFISPEHIFCNGNSPVSCYYFFCVHKQWRNDQGVNLPVCKWAQLNIRQIRVDLPPFGHRAQMIILRSVRRDCRTDGYIRMQIKRPLFASQIKSKQTYNAPLGTKRRKTLFSLFTDSLFV